MSREMTIGEHQNIGLWELSDDQLDGLDGNRSEVVPTPPFCDENSLSEGIPPAAEIQDEILDEITLYDSVEEGLGHYVQADVVHGLQNSTPVPLESIKSGHSQYISKDHPPNGNSELQRHWRKLVKSLPEGTEIKVCGDHVMVSYQIGNMEDDRDGRVAEFVDDTVERIRSGRYTREDLDFSRLDNAGSAEAVNTVNFVFDLSEDSSSKKDGLALVGVLQERHVEDVEDKVWDVTATTPPGTNIYFKDHSLWVKIFNPARWLLSGGSIDLYEHGDELRGNIELYHLPLDLGRYVAHEGDHIRSLTGNSGRLTELGKFGLVRIGSDLSLVFGEVAQRIFRNPWMFWVPAIASIGMYFLSRRSNNPVGKSFYEFMREERGAYLRGEVWMNLMQKNGFAMSDKWRYPGFGSENVYYSRVPALAYYWLYEPAIWAALDSMAHAGRWAWRKVWGRRERGVEERGGAAREGVAPVPGVAGLRGMRQPFFSTK